MPLTLADFDYALPPELVAQAPLPQRSASRLLVVDGERRTDSQFVDLPQWLRAGDLLVMNDSRVLHARLLGRKESGGQVEVLVERLLEPDVVLAQVRASKSPQPGSRLRLEDVLDVEVLGREGEFYRLRFAGDAAELIEQHGRLPLPPYIERTAEAPDELRYQTVYARETGSVAAPTAGLHFDHDLLAKLREKQVEVAYVTLHVGAGTFQPVRVENLAEHRMHTERYLLPQSTADAIAATRARGGRIVAVGTTSLRVLESAALDGKLKVGAGETALFVTPGFKFRVVDLLITNFHLSKSTLLMLVSAFGGLEEIRDAYRHAIAARYRFFSYGDAMLLHRKST
ncbi:tRNA preQ1(34) S-adenosylmethionine ribosyltransferase-isomerase QueA [Sulfuritalea hydrogenivorans]|uniref:S-adenosylmethionine:tRNA ribosyltransferase-isomerase n=1 Tax=Sulfuritalea hydrogenivorans sk43H TaxID=1223802 RepID=W0SI61_9PROT|nr:tRNA preQ1(34) S-adenosylmethionine ribosyltransferase-isomerase QueA [Sulfuritalea hydrogenivorans]MDK9714120.1 tRNA preQ1(34) S-adenosylmethionine ribosyltransferase-isomerase QueA [Sulfuritalea sp.]BAO30502.1 S-adenosylmethionine:tRNA ribosyltransferase-isomerase [Sulfuritalea hydrogenivorans sk43H]